MHQLILASESPRRKILLDEAGFSFVTFPVKVSEILDKNLTSSLTIDQQIMKISEIKAQAAFEVFKPSKTGAYLILSADTMVVFDNTPLGKPKNLTEAARVLRLLSGKTHQVKTAITLLEFRSLSQNESTPGKIAERIATTDITFRKLNEAEILEYVNTGDPLDKAGSYGIQSGAGKFVSHINGSYDNVVGLPIATLQNLLQENGWKV